MTPCWVTRDNDGCFNKYQFHDKKPPRRLRNGMFVVRGLFTTDTYLFERLTGFRLSPGEGPVKVRIEVKRCK